MADYYVAPKSSFDATADAIREKTGSSADIEWTQDGFADAISSIKGDRENLCEPLDVNFIDYDGRLLYSYTAADFLQLESLPSNPTNDGLVSQGWNWSLSDAKTHVSITGGLLIGQMYITTDQKTHINISIPQSPRKLMQLYFGQTQANGIDVDWGDGNTETISSTGVSAHTHTYTKGGDYEIIINIKNGQIVWNDNSSGCIAGLDSTQKENYYSSRAYITSVYLGSGFTSLGTRRNISGLQTIKTITIPSGVTSIPEYCLSSNPALKAIVIPDTVSTIGQYCLQQCYSMTRASLPKTITTINNHLLRQCYSLDDVHIPSECTTLNTGAFYRGYAITRLVIPSGISSIATETFYQCCSLKELHLLSTTPPSLANTNAFTDTPSDCIFYVPYSYDHSILDAYKSATNWSSFSSRFQEEPQ